MTDDAFTERQRALAQTFQAQLQALYTQQTEADHPSAAALMGRLAEILKTWSSCAPTSTIP